MTIKKEIQSDILKGSDVCQEKQLFRHVLVRFPTNTLSRLDDHLKKKSWLSRNAWIMQAIQDKLVDDENG